MPKTLVPKGKESCILSGSACLDFANLWGHAFRDASNGRTQKIHPFDPFAKCHLKTSHRIL